MRPLLALLLLVSPLAGCLETGDPSGATEQAPAAGASFVFPARPLPEVITGLVPVANADINGGEGIWVDPAGYVYHSGRGFSVVDVRDPANPAVLSALPVRTRDTDLVVHPNGVKTAVLADGGHAMRFVNVTDPENLRDLVTLEMPADVHNVAVLPGTAYVYNSRSNLSFGDGWVDIVNASDPRAPFIEATWRLPELGSTGRTASPGCHDIYFSRQNPRGYCAGISETILFDPTDPLAPQVLGVVRNPAINIHHSALPARNDTLLIIGDEYGGAALPGCLGAADVPGRGTASTPTGALWFYDIADPANPRLLGWLSAPPPVESLLRTPSSPGFRDVFRSCTAHFGTLVEDRELLVWGWYSAGTLLVDFSDPRAPRLLDREPGGSVWDARYFGGYVFTGDELRGLDVLTFE